MVTKQNFEFKKYFLKFPKPNQIHLCSLDITNFDPEKQIDIH